MTPPQPQPGVNPLSIFILHASDLATDHRPHGDGLSAYGFLSGLAARGHQIHLAAIETDIREPLPSNFIIHHIPIRAGTTFLSRLNYAIRTRLLYEKLNKEWHFDIVQQMVPVKTGLSLGMLGIKAPLVLGTFVARWPHEAHHYPESPVPFRKRFRDACAWPLTLLQIGLADALLVTSPFATAGFPLRRFFLKKTYEIHHGIDVDTFCPGPSDEAKREKTILYLGALAVRKGIYTIIEAFELVHRECPEARLVIAGTGQEEVKVRKRIAELQSRGQIEMLGSVPRSQVPETMRSAAIYCPPAYGEPYATSLLEAMACGCAAVVTDSGGAPYMVPISGGRCVPNRDASALANALIELLRKPDETREMGKKNRQFVSEQYTWSGVLSHLEEVYRIVISGQKVSVDFSPKETFGSR